MLCLLLLAALAVTSCTPDCEMMRGSWSTGPLQLSIQFLEYPAEEKWALLSCSSLSCEDASCTTAAAPGAALDQYHHFRRMQKEVCHATTKFAPSVSATYVFEKLKVQAGSLSFEIVENLSGAYGSAGGSSFDIRLSGPAILVCATLDLYTGRYSVECRAPALTQPELLWNLTVVIDYVKYGALYNPVATVADGTFLVSVPFATSLLACSLTMLSSTPAIQADRLCTRADISHSSGYWIGDHWRFSGCSLKVYAKAELEQCIPRFASVQLIGASHVRFLHDRFVDLLGGDLSGLEVKHHDAVFNKTGYRVGFQWISFASDMRDALPRDPPAGVFILQSGRWDVWKRGADVFMNAMVGVLERIAEWGNATTVIWLQIPPVGLQFDNQGFAKNNVQIAAIHEWLMPRLHSAGAHTIPYFDMTLPRRTEYACPLHYMCTDHNHSILRRPAGDAVFQVILNSLCNEL